jgi:hypothetical protein
MSMIFANFPNEAAARAFEQATDGRVYTTYVVADADDPFPFVFFLPVVHLDHILTACGAIDMAAEAATADLARTFGGEFIGT